MVAAKVGPECLQQHGRLCRSGRNGEICLKAREVGEAAYPQIDKTWLHTSSALTFFPVHVLSQFFFLLVRRSLLFWWGRMLCRISFPVMTLSTVYVLPLPLHRSSSHTQLCTEWFCCCCFFLSCWGDALWPSLLFVDAAYSRKGLASFFLGRSWLLSVHNGACVIAVTLVSPYGHVTCIYFPLFFSKLVIFLILKVDITWVSLVILSFFILFDCCCSSSRLCADSSFLPWTTFFVSIFFFHESPMPR